MTRTGHRSRQIAPCVSSGGRPRRSCREYSCHARDDDEPFTRRVASSCTRTATTSGSMRGDAKPGADVLQEIRDAVRSRDRLIVVLGPRAARSDYVRADRQAALVDGKVVTPVLRLGDYDLVPAELKNLHCPDVRSGQARAGGLRRAATDPARSCSAARHAQRSGPRNAGPFPAAPSTTCPALAGTLLYDIEHPR